MDDRQYLNKAKDALASVWIGSKTDFRIHNALWRLERLLDYQDYRKQKVPCKGCKRFYPMHEIDCPLNGNF